MVSTTCFIHLFVAHLCIKYWGWVTYHYREENKEKFEQAKQAAIKWLDECPDEVICRFVNQVWQFIDTYHHGLSGKLQSRLCELKKVIVALQRLFEGSRAVWSFTGIGNLSL
jgi:cbb3-type cytochrome oxidase subunit 3